MTDAAVGTGLGITFSLEHFSSVHVWVVDGGWRSIRCAVIEPWSGYPARLDVAIAEGRARHLDPGGRITTEVRYISFDARNVINGFDQEGRPL